jgi:hypothetical protein
MGAIAVAGNERFIMPAILHMLLVNPNGLKSVVSRWIEPLALKNASSLWLYNSPAVYLFFG